MVFYSIWKDSRGYGKGYYTYVLPEQIGRENYCYDDVAYWYIPGVVL